MHKGGVAPHYAADSSVPILDRGRNTIEKKVGSSTMLLDNGQIIAQKAKIIVYG